MYKTPKPTQSFLNKPREFYFEQPKYITEEEIVKKEVEFREKQIELAPNSKYSHVEEENEFEEEEEEEEEEGEIDEEYDEPLDSIDILDEMIDPELDQVDSIEWE